MKKALKYSSFIAVWASVSFGVWMTILTAYELITGPETFTKFELFMSILVSCHIAEKICDFVFKVQEVSVDKPEDTNNIISLDEMIKIYEEEFSATSYISRQNTIYLKELKRYREGVIQNDR